MKRAIILAGGKGTRLRPYTVCIPKPLMPVGDRPILEIVIKQLVKHDFKRITITVGHLHELVRNFFMDGEKFGAKIDYVIEDKPLGTAGSIVSADDITDDFLVMNGDLLTTIDYTKIFEFHKRTGSAATIATFKRDMFVDYGVLHFDESGNLDKYVEKPVNNYYVSMGINIFSKKVMNLIGKGEKIDIPELIERIKNKGELVKCYQEDCKWLDIGRLEDYELAINEFEKNKELYI